MNRLESPADAIRRSRHARTARLAEIRGKTPCRDCGNVFPHYMMDFDHRDPSSKVGNVVEMAKTCVAWHRVMAEVRKCDVVCARCHRARSTPGPTRRAGRSKRYISDRIKLDEIKGAPCRDCGGVFRPCQMDFDHVRGEKVAPVTRLIGRPDGAMLLEIEKCDLVCANCHRARTWHRPSSRSCQRKPATLSPAVARRAERAAMTTLSCVRCFSQKERVFQPTPSDVSHLRQRGRARQKAHEWRRTIGPDWQLDG
jgi:hypothetical protein